MGWGGVGWGEGGRAGLRGYSRSVFFRFQGRGILTVMNDQLEGLTAGQLLAPTDRAGRGGVGGGGQAAAAEGVG